MPKTKSDSTNPTSVIAPNTVIRIDLPWAEVGPVYEQVLKNMAKRVKSPGFRPGKVPAHLAVDIIGQENIKEEVLKKVLPAHYQTAIQKANKQPLTYPEFKAVHVDLNQDWEIEAYIAEKPEINVKDYQKVVKEAQKTAEKHIKEDEKAAKAAATKDKKPQEKTSEQKAAEEKEHKLQIIFRELISHYKPSIPELLIKEEAQGELEQMIRSLSQLNMKLDDYLARRQMSFEQLSGELATQALTRLQLDFLLQAIIETANIKADQKEIDEYLNRIKDDHHREEHRQDPQYINYISSVITRQKVGDHLLSL